MPVPSKCTNIDRLNFRFYYSCLEYWLPTRVHVQNYCSGASQKGGETHCYKTFFYPISLLPTNVKKILAKVPVAWFSAMVHTVIHLDQTRLLPNKSSTLYTHRVFLNTLIPVDNLGNGALLSLEISKTLDGIEWRYLWDLFSLEIWFAPSFCNWVKPLYVNPSAKISVKGKSVFGFQKWLLAKVSKYSQAVFT